MSPTTSVPTTEVGAPLRADHRLEILAVDLVGGYRAVPLKAGLNLVVGDITTGKTTFVRLLKAALGSVPNSLPPEVAAVRALNVSFRLRGEAWNIYRPLVTTRDAPVEIANVVDGGDAIRVRAAGAEKSYSRFLLDHLGLPAVSVPEGAVSDARYSPVSMTDWLAYCIVTGDELDSSVFGHDNEWRNRKRKWIFQLIYGLYDADTLRLAAERRSLQLRLDGLDQETAVIQRFLDRTPFSDPKTLQGEYDKKQLRLEELRAMDTDDVVVAAGAPEVGRLRFDLLKERRRLSDLEETEQLSESQLVDLRELRRQLVSQSAKLTRAIVSQDWMVDFDFIVCPRCGSSVAPVDDPDDSCYLCHQPERSGNSQEVLLAEQDRVVSQISETDVVITDRLATLEVTRRELRVSNSLLEAYSDQLNRATDAYVSDRATSIRLRARESAELETEASKLLEYRDLLVRAADRTIDREFLEQQLDDISIKIESKQLELSVAEENVAALEARMLEYLERLHIPALGDTLTVNINRATYMPEVSLRTFVELSSQGLKTLVNVAHALAHHTVAIDRGLPLPGLLVLDGLSANTGHEGFDRDRVEDLYRLLVEVGAQYSGSLQIVAVDNDLPAALMDEIRPLVALALSQDDRLIRNSYPVVASDDGPKLLP